MNNSLFNGDNSALATAQEINVIPTIDTVDYNKIYLFTDLSVFGYHPNNRSIKPELVKKYKKSMLNGASEALIGVMIVDIKTLQIYDAQHRGKAYTEAQQEGYSKPFRVMFIEAPDDVDEQIKLINQLNDGCHWNIKDNIHSHMDGDNDLRKLYEFCINHEWLYKETKRGKNKGKREPFMRRGAAIVTGNPRFYKTSLKNGTFKCDKIEWDEAEDVYSEVMEILKALRLNNQTDIPALEGIINGWYAVRNSKKCYRQIEKLPNGLNNVYEYMSPEKMDTRHTTSPSIWEDRFKSAVENAYKAYC